MTTRSPIRYSAATGGFYHLDLHGIDRIPADAVPVSAKRHAALLEAHAGGSAIVADAAGRPRLATPAATIEQRRAAAVAAVRREARRRILAIASIERQSNDNAALALAAITGAPAASGALHRRQSIDLLRAAAASAIATLAGLDREGIETFQPAWPEEPK